MGSAAEGTARRLGATNAENSATWPATARMAEATHAGTAEKWGTRRSSVLILGNLDPSVEGSGVGDVASEAAQEAGEVEEVADLISVISGAIQESAATDRGVDSTTSTRRGPDRAGVPGREEVEVAAPGPGTGASAGVSILPTLRTLAKAPEARAKMAPATGTKAEVKAATLEKHDQDQNPAGLWTAPTEEPERRLRRARDTLTLFRLHHLHHVQNT